jgi:hypothetical protein
MDTMHLLTRDRTEPTFPFYLANRSGDSVVRGKGKWVSEDVAYVLVPFGTATASREEWEATVVGGMEGGQGLPLERHVSVQLIAADHCMNAEEELEGLLLRVRHYEDPVRSRRTQASTIMQA